MSREDLPLIEVVINNHVLGMVRQWQTLYYGKRYSATVLRDKVDFCKVAEGFGVTAYRVTEKEEFEKVFKEALKEDGPVWIDCIIDREEKVLPMIPAGGSTEDMIIG